MPPSRTPAALWLWYRGGGFRGFQRQVGGETVQDALEAALRACGVEAGVMPAGRTDRGVHARMQVVSVRLPPGLDADALAHVLPGHLPPGLGLCVARRPAPAFHAQWSAAGKAYRYRLWLGADAPPEAWAGSCFRVALEPRLVGRQPAPERLAERLAEALGPRDFIAFHEHSSPRKVRTLTRASVHALGGALFEVRLEGDGFARYQVRYLVGSALLAATGVVAEADWRAALERAHTLPGLKAPPEGLVLWEVRYPPGLDPFPPSERAAPPHLPPMPPFTDGGDGR